jgi:hypothetical protein
MIPTDINRRHMILGSTGSVLTSASAFADDPYISPEKIAERANAPIISKKVERRFNTRPTIREPNAMQFTPDGKLWLLDQVDPNKVFTVDPGTGQILAQVQTESIHGSGITYGDDAWWITSTKVLVGNPSTLKVDPKTGVTLKKWETPGWGIYGVYTRLTPKPGDLPLASGGHGVRWTGNGRYWMAVPASGKLYLMEAETNRVIRTLPAPTVRTHGIALDGDFIWCVGSDEMEIYKLAVADGKIVAKIALDKKTDPSIHCIDIKDETIWYCDANQGWICRLM